MKFLKFSLLFIIVSLLLTNQNKAQEFKEFEKNESLSKTGKVYLENYKGKINITGWDKEEISVYAKMIPDNNSWFSKSDEEQLDNVKIKYRKSGETVHIETKYRDDSFNNNGRAEVHYTIKMPYDAVLKLDDYKSMIKIEEIKNITSLETYKGFVKITGLESGIRLETYKGDVDLDFDKISDDSRFETYKGEINIRIPEKASFDIDADLDNRGDFYSDFDFENEESNSRKRGRKTEYIKASVNGGGSKISFDTHKGSFRISKK